MNQKSSLQTIASRIGVSVTTVSRVLSGKAEKYRISSKTIARIEEEAARSNYTPNLLAQGLRTQRTRTIGVIIPGIENPFFATLASIIVNMLQERGYHTLLADSTESEKEEAQALQMFRARQVDGIIAVPVTPQPDLHERIASQIPLVLIDRYFESTTLPYICTDNFVGARMATEHLLSHDRRRILAIQGVHDAMPNRERVRGVLSAIEGRGDVSCDIVGDAFSVENGYVQTLRAFRPGRDSGPAVSPLAYDSIFAFSSTILLGTINALRELGIRIPADLSLISYDNNGFLDFLNPPVTHIAQPLRESGQMAIDALLELISSRHAGLPDPAPIQRLIAPELVVRSSC